MQGIKKNTGWFRYHASSGEDTGFFCQGTLADKKTWAGLPAVNIIPSIQ